MAKLNNKTLYKLRDETLCVLLQNYMGKNVLYSKEDILDGKGGQIDEDSYNDSFENSVKSQKNFDITATKVFDTQSEVLRAIFDEACPYLKWDWEREDIKEMTQEEIEKELGYKIKILPKEE